MKVKDHQFNIFLWEYDRETGNVRFMSHDFYITDLMRFLLMVSKELVRFVGENPPEKTKDQWLEDE